jgi:hypothetical protein
MTIRGKRLADLIRKAIEDGVVTTKEYDDILAMVNEDMQIDDEERDLLDQLLDMIDNKTVRRVS